MVSRTQYASLVSAIIWSCHLIWRWRGVFSRRGGRGKEWTFSFGFGGIISDNGKEKKFEMGRDMAMRMVTAIEVFIKKEDLAVIDVASVLRCSEVDVEFSLIHGIC